MVPQQYPKPSKMFDVYSFMESAREAIIPLAWYIVAAIVVLLYLQPYIKKKYNSWRHKKDEFEYSAKYHKDSDMFQQRQTAMEAARLRMQAQYIQDAEKARQREQERIEKKKQALMELTEGIEIGKKLGYADGNGSASGSKPSSKSSSKSLKSEYNPLMGETSRGYRAPKRSCCGKGGCG
ncbi:selenoprotein S-like [Diprion similis]|uniref:selenoprotein S-like n=1 Tax=Diprion similis TaxID=362088 RepID=UPI001EF8FBCA|nr:selenoprotein S-like [Diprion similis]